MKSKIFIFFFCILVFSCDTNNPDNPGNNDINNTVGFGILDKLKGIWNGPVSSTTALGSYQEWIVDFRPVSNSQISAKNELDSLNDINMSFFIAKYNNQYRVFFRNGGSFNGMKRISYFLCDSVNENASQSYYRFSEVVIGKTRAYCELIFKNNGDSMSLKTYTNVYNTLPNAVLHMTWNAKRVDQTACMPAVNQFGFPQKQLTRDFSETFTGVTEAIYYGLAGDPYPESDQPYLGVSNISFTYLPSYTPDPSKKVLLVITTQPLISGFTLNTANLKYRSRYIITASTHQSYAFNYMHPGTYYLYAIYDADNNLNANSGDWVSTTNTTFNLSAEGTINSTTQINFTIP